MNIQEAFEKDYFGGNQPQKGTLGFEKHQYCQVGAQAWKVLWGFGMNDDYWPAVRLPEPLSDPACGKLMILWSGPGSEQT